MWTQCYSRYSRLLHCRRIRYQLGDGEAHVKTSLKQTAAVISPHVYHYPPMLSCLSKCSLQINLTIQTVILSSFKNYLFKAQGVKHHNPASFSLILSSTFTQAQVAKKHTLVGRLDSHTPHYTPLFLKQVTNEDQLYSTGDSTSSNSP